MSGHDPFNPPSFDGHSLALNGAPHNLTGQWEDEGEDVMMADDTVQRLAPKHFPTVWLVSTSFDIYLYHNSRATRA